MESPERGQTVRDNRASPTPATVILTRAPTAPCAPPPPAVILALVARTHSSAGSVDAVSGQSEQSLIAVGWVSAANAISRQVESIASRVSNPTNILGCWVTRGSARGAMFVHPAALTQPTF